MKILSFAFLLLFPALLTAHPLNLGYLEIKINSREKEITTVVEINPKILKSDDSFNEILGNTYWISKQKPCTWTKHNIEKISNDQIRIIALSHCEEGILGSVELNLEFLKNTTNDFQFIGRINNEEDESAFNIDHKNRIIKVSASENKKFFNFAFMGIKHIGATPSEWINEKGIHLPDGVDHILFVILLVIAGGNFKEILKTVTGFTAGHSITLALATLGIIHASPQLIEPLIALTIVYVALEIVFLRASKHRWRVSLFFGLIHGFGFAAALEGLKLSMSQMLKALAGFNLGVEIGQLIIVLFTLPLLLVLKNKVSSKTYITQAASLAVAIVGGYWFYQRSLPFIKTYL